MEVEPGSVRAGREFTWFISIVDMDIISIKMLQENAGLLIDSVSDTVKHEIKKQVGVLLAELVNQKKDKKVDLFRYYYLYFFHRQLEKES